MIDGRWIFLYSAHSKGGWTCFLHIQGPSGILATHLWGEENPLAPVLWCLACVCLSVCLCTPVKTTVFVWNPCVWGCVCWCTRDCFIPHARTEGNVISVWPNAVWEKHFSNLDLHFNSPHIVLTDNWWPVLLLDASVFKSLKATTLTKYWQGTKTNHHKILNLPYFTLPLGTGFQRLLYKLWNYIL